MTQETIFQILTEAALEARKDKAKELSALLNTFLSDLREHVTGGVSASIYGIYKPTDEQVVPFLVKTIQGPQTIYYSYGRYLCWSESSS